VVPPQYFLARKCSPRSSVRRVSRGLLLVTWFAFGLGKLEKSQVMKAMRLTLNEHHRKLRGVGDISDWLVSADVSGFCHPYRASEWLHRCTRPGRWLHFRYLPRLPAASHDFLLPPTTFCCLLRLSAASYDYLLPSTTPSLRPLGEIPETPCLGCFYGVVTT
jgi:hypothetical protein